MDCAGAAHLLREIISQETLSSFCLKTNIAVVTDDYMWPLVSISAPKRK
jgi:hypothetical protein